MGVRRELARMASGVRWKKTNIVARRSSGVAEMLTRMGSIGFDLHPKKIDSGHQWTSKKKTRGVDIG
ncbi:hypothetical protein B296_00010413 [Ensete ventricosum]|uniref:Uncharacterized protein n=1 Tax=Ensete ventricosum TaxID=4639 RepID=A0A427AWP0_ENSVE|nr:hypothetical protein B296_00010413 [Ensete ventricosum]